MGGAITKSTKKQKTEDSVELMGKSFKKPEERLEFTKKVQALRFASLGYNLEYTLKKLNVTYETVKDWNIQTLLKQEWERRLGIVLYTNFLLTYEVIVIEAQLSNTEGLKSQNKFKELIDMTTTKHLKEEEIENRAKRRSKKKKDLKDFAN